MIVLGYIYILNYRQEHVPVVCMCSVSDKKGIKVDRDDNT